MQRVNGYPVRPWEANDSERMKEENAEEKEETRAAKGRRLVVAAAKLKIKIYDCIKRLKCDTGCAEGNFRNNAGPTTGMSNYTVNLFSFAPPAPFSPVNSRGRAPRGKVRADISSLRKHCDEKFQRKAHHPAGQPSFSSPLFHVFALISTSTYELSATRKRCVIL